MKAATFQPKRKVVTIPMEVDTAAANDAANDILNATATDAVDDGDVVEKK
jgi:hypothetical protein